MALERGRVGQCSDSVAGMCTVIAWHQCPGPLNLDRPWFLNNLWNLGTGKGARSLSKMEALLNFNVVVMNLKQT